MRVVDLAIYNKGALDEYLGLIDQSLENLVSSFPRLLKPA